MIGTDVGNPGEREFQSQTTGRFGKGGGTYRALAHEAEIEIVPLPNFRVEVGGTASLHDVTGVPDIDDRRQFNFQGASLDLRYRLLDRERAPFGLTVAAEFHGDRIDETSGAKGRMYGTDLALAFDRETHSELRHRRPQPDLSAGMGALRGGGAVGKEFDNRSGVRGPGASGAQHAARRRAALFSPI
ncbi:hypothetical protein ACVOMS_14510 [Bradyrhizobium guangxiense]